MMNAIKDFKRSIFLKKWVWAGALVSVALMVRELFYAPSPVVDFMKCYLGDHLAAIILNSILHREGVYYHLLKGVFLFIPSSALAVYLGTLVLKKIIRMDEISCTPGILPVSFALGVSCISTLVALAGSLGLVQKWLGYALLICGLAALLPAGKISWRSIKELCSVEKNDAGSIFILQVMLFLAILLTMLCVVPLIYNQDVLHSHWALASHYMQAGNITPLSYHWYSFSPQNSEMIYMWQLLLGSEISARLFNSAYYLAVLFAVISFAKKKADAWIGWFAGALFFFLPTISFIAQTPKNDGSVMMYSFLAILITAEILAKDGADQSEKYRTLFLAGLLSGGALGAKYTGLPQFATLSGLIIFSSFYNKKLPLSESLKSLGIFIAGAAVFSWFWYARNLWITHDPLYPWGSGLFPTRFVSPQHKDLLLTAFSEQARNMTKNGVTTLLTSLFGIKPGYYAALSPLLLVLTPSLIVMKEIRHREIRWMAIASFISLMIGLAIFRQFRNFLGEIAVLVTVIAVCTGILCADSQRIRNFLSLTVVFLWFSPANRWAHSYLSYGPYLLLSGRDPIEIQMNVGREEVNTNDIEFFKRYVNKNLSKESRILFVGENRAAGFERKFISNGIHENVAETFIKGCADLRELEERFKKDGITHLLLGAGGIGQVSPLENDLFTQYIQRRCEPVTWNEKRSCILLAIKSS